MAYPVELVGGDAGFDGGGDDIHDGPPERTRRAHLCQLLGRFHLQLVLQGRGELSLRPAGPRVVRERAQPPNLGHRPLGRHLHRTQRPGPLKLRHLGRAPVLPRAAVLYVVRPLAVRDVPTRERRRIALIRLGPLAGGRARRRRSSSSLRLLLFVRGVLPSRRRRRRIAPTRRRRVLVLLVLEVAPAAPALGVRAVRVRRRRSGFVVCGFVLAAGLRLGRPARLEIIVRAVSRVSRVGDLVVVLHVAREVDRVRHGRRPAPLGRPLRGGGGGGGLRHLRADARVVEEGDVELDVLQSAGDEGC